MSTPVLTPKDMRAYMRSLLEPREFGQIMPQTYFARFPARTLLYTSKADLTVVTPFYPMFNGKVVGIRINVSGAPSSTFTADLLFDGNSIFSGSAKPTIASGALFGYRAFVTDRPSFQYDTKMLPEIEAAGGATGPMVMAIEYLPE